MDSEKALVVFEDKKIRRIWHNDEWYFSVVDIVVVLTDSTAPRQYWGVLKGRENQLLTICLQLKLVSSDGKKYSTDCANTEGIFRIIQSIPSPKAEPFKRWLAKVGYEEFTPLDSVSGALSNGVKEIQDPEIAQKRMKEIYKQKGYSDNWIEKRVRGIAIRDELTDSPRWIAIQSDIIQRGKWDNRGINQNIEYALLTNEISKATFGLNPTEYKYNGLKI